MKILIKILFFLILANPSYAFEMPATIEHEYPNAESSQYTVRINGENQDLTYWDSALGAQPSLATLQAAWPAAELAQAKRLKIKEIKTEGLSRIQQVVPGIISFDHLQLVKEMILSVDPAARQLTPNMQLASDIYQAGSDAAAIINGYTTVSQVHAFDPVSDVSWL